MSGGVDSSATAAMLHREGCDVVGISMRLYGESRAGRSCCSPDDLLDAREVAAACGFPFYVANFQELFQERVIDHFVDEYRRGRTPSPCVLCNDHLKFDVLLERMFALDAQWLATGHYARIEQIGDRSALLRGVDTSRDQSYFLFGIPREKLQFIRFPLGDLTKDRVRAIAAELGLASAAKPESQDICFVGDGGYVKFVEERLSESERRPGPIIREKTGEVVGQHEGIHRFTIGQRRGIGVAGAEPLYVRGIHAETGTVYVGTRDEVVDGRFRVERCNWLRWESAPARFESLVQLRYRHKAVPATIELDADGAGGGWVQLKQAEAGIAPGQAAVFYDGDEVLGGGWIERVG